MQPFFSPERKSPAKTTAAAPTGLLSSKTCDGKATGQGLQQANAGQDAAVALVL
ncbi:TPA: hypothetical protein ACH3X2_006203 [Trebouxia sp. C0005]